MTTAGDIRRQLDDDMWDSMLQRTAEYRQELLRKRAAMTAGDIVERVAKAIHAVEFEPGDSEIAATMEDPSIYAFRLEQARAALAAAGPGREVMRQVLAAILDEEANSYDPSYAKGDAKRSKEPIFKAFKRLADNIRTMEVYEVVFDHHMSRALASQPAKPVRTMVVRNDYKWGDDPEGKISVAAAKPVPVEAVEAATPEIRDAIRLARAAVDRGCFYTGQASMVVARALLAMAGKE